MVYSRPIPGREPWLVGWFDYRGTLLPLFDSSRLLGQDASEIRMSSRILVMQVDEIEAQPPYRLGLVVEHVLGVETLEFDERAAHPKPASPALAFLGAVALTNGGTVQLTIPHRFPVVHQ